MIATVVSEGFSFKQVFVYNHNGEIHAMHNLKGWEDPQTIITRIYRGQVKVYDPHSLEAQLVKQRNMELWGTDDNRRRVF